MFEVGKRTITVKVHLDEQQFSDLSRLAMARDRKVPDMAFAILMDRLYGERRLFTGESAWPDTASGGRGGQHED